MIPEDEFDDGEVEVIRPYGNRAIHDPGQSPHETHAYPEADEEPALSKTRIKKQMHELRDIGKELTELSRDQLDQLDIPDSLRDAIDEMRRIHKFGAQRRQLQYIGKLMREVDPAPIVARLDAWKGKSREQTAYMHLLERWRDRLMDSEAVLTELMTDYPGVDVQHLRALIRNAHKEIEQNKPPKNYREIFQMLKTIIPETP